MEAFQVVWYRIFAGHSLHTDIQLLLLLFPPSFCLPPPTPSLWQVNKINIHPTVAIAGMSDSLSCHQLCVCVCVCVCAFVLFDACVRVYFQHSLSLLAGACLSNPPPHISVALPLPRLIRAHMGPGISLAHCVPVRLMAVHQSSPGRCAVILFWMVK